MWKCQKSGTQLSTACNTPQVFWIGNQIGLWCSLGTCPPNTKTEYLGVGQPFLSKMQFSETTHFLKSIQMALESSKSDICQKSPELVLGYVSRSIVCKFDPKSPKGSVPNVQSKFLTCDAIRWFKCKLKPPNNWVFFLFMHSTLCGWMHFEKFHHTFFGRWFCLCVIFKMAANSECYEMLVFISFYFTIIT